MLFVESRQNVKETKYIKMIGQYSKKIQEKEKHCGIASFLPYFGSAVASQSSDNGEVKVRFSHTGPSKMWVAQSWLPDFEKGPNCPVYSSFPRPMPSPSKILAI
jgi:hypothetical protein